MVHIGSKIKSQAESIGMGPTKFGEHLNRSRENVYDLYGRETVDSGLLLACCKILNHDFFQYYYEEDPMFTFRAEVNAAWIAKVDGLKNDILQKDQLLKKNEELIFLQRKYISELEQKLSQP